ncbi:hypothetical protein BAUCODRAFT_147728 [Baudoinia panamericana UAMH 10762]|uniref:Enoyl reductase (ER) domain-containing protein n=1 Tax=Baudoinia panamericana (strain UAMH 10762) TaxID=717646 RepID=M2MLY1_BAUPA|nr:uncharacterized protein BAUCODRAFT_147728 [Baudoinia panamericana UAMH 10762]EMC97681.1 hypothetical protein BAUCODRAFT_147728 [Baudoinia panamericana UAMH 10762]
MSSTSSMMRAAYSRALGPASNLEPATIPIPTPQPGQVLIRFGRAPIGPVQLPRVLSIEAAGIIEAAPGSEEAFPRGAIVLTTLGGMGVMFDGAYAEYTCVSKANVHVLKRPTTLDWKVLGALPVMLQTAHGSLFRGLKLKAGETLLVRGGTTSVGLAAAAIATNTGAKGLATTRRGGDQTARTMKESGADQKAYPAGVDKVLELVGGYTLPDSLSCLAEGGICCFTGLVGGSPTAPQFHPLGMIATERYLTAYGERMFHARKWPIDELVQHVEDGSLKVQVGKVVNIDQIMDAHEYVESHAGLGKVVVLV